MSSDASGAGKPASSAAAEGKATAPPPKTYTGRPALFRFACNPKIKPVRLVDSANAQDAFSAVDYRTFELRGKNYLNDSKKFPSAPPVFRCSGMVLIATQTPVFHAAEKLKELKAYLSDNAGASPFFFVFQWMLPGPPFMSVLHVFFRDIRCPEGTDAAFDKVFDLFLNGDDDVRRSKFKYKAHFDTAPFMVKAAVSALGGERPCIIGNKLECSYFRGENYLEIDCNISSSTIAKNIAGVVVRAGGRSVVIDHGFLLEGHAEAELPERLMAAVRYSHIDQESCAVDLSGDAPRAYDSKEYRYKDPDTGALRALDD
jgi:hypothetical protein